MKHAFVLVSLLALSLGCRQASAPQPAAKPPATSAQPSAPSQPPAVRPMPAQLPAILAKVNGEPIERWEIENAVKRVEARAGGPMPADKRDEVLRGVLDQLVDYHLLAQESRARKFEVTAADVEARMSQMRRGFPDEDAFKQGVAAQGLTVEQLQRQARTDLEISKLLDAEVNAKVSVQDAEVDAFYKQNIERFKEGETVHASHILLGVPQNADAAQKGQTRAAAEALLKKIRAGADFGALARQQSQDSDSARNGGDLGFFPKGQMTPAFEAAAFALKPGGVSRVVETPFGFHIIKLHARRPPRTVPFAEASGQIKEFLARNQRETRLEQFVTQAKAKSKVEMLV
jgi:peptidyl-prolyl cis-trans isomerase C